MKILCVDLEPAYGAMLEVMQVNSLLFIIWLEGNKIAISIVTQVVKLYKS